MSNRNSAPVLFSFTTGRRGVPGRMCTPQFSRHFQHTFGIHDNLGQYPEFALIQTIPRQPFHLVRNRYSPPRPGIDILC